MSVWKDMISRQQEERKKLMVDTIVEHGSKSAAARHLGISRQQVNQFVNHHELEGKIYIEQLIDVVEEISVINRKRRKPKERDRNQ